MVHFNISGINLMFSFLIWCLFIYRGQSYHQTTYNTITSAQETIVVPSGMDLMFVELRGARGGRFGGYYGGNGARVLGSMTVFAGQVFRYNIGSHGDDKDSSSSGGYNGGGNGGSPSGCGGGGATDLRTSDGGIADRIFVAGGGGGADSYNFFNGGAAGRTGLNGAPSSPQSGNGATQSQVGSGGCFGNTCGNSGSNNIGGDGYFISGGGGGGGGYFGGGGGYEGGGGGGSSYASVSHAFDVSYFTGENDGHGSLTVTFYTSTFTSYTGLQESFQIPPGVNVMTVTATGARGGDGGSVAGGLGGMSQASFFVVPLATIYYNLGGHGTDAAGGAGGYNGGGQGGSCCGSGGGGATDIRLIPTGPDSLDSRILVAAGGGGADGPAARNGGSGGEVGLNGEDTGTNGGFGATALTPGSGGCSGFDFDCASDGVWNVGGSGEAFGGGGGGGYFGGGGGYYGGGGGSSYIHPSHGFNTLLYTGVGSGDGSLSVTFSFMPFLAVDDVQIFVVPMGATFMTVDMYGARGGSSGTATGGYGARVQCTVEVTPGDLYYVFVGGHGTDIEGGSIGGYNGGGNGGSLSGQGGGGATDIRTIYGDENSRIIVAGGGGGAFAPASTNGGAGGLVGEAGEGGSAGGGGASEVAGGSEGCAAVDCGYSGDFGLGGDGWISRGGGGGGGYYGGGGGRNAGGGGSSRVPRVATDVIVTTGVGVGHGSCSVSFIFVPEPSSQPSQQPSSQPSVEPSSEPTQQPSVSPTIRPSTQPTCQPTFQPNSNPTSQPSLQPSKQPSASPTDKPSVQPSILPSTQPTGSPSMQPTNQPTFSPSSQPSSQPLNQPSSQPSSQPSRQSSSLPSSLPSNQPSGRPSSQPSSQPSSHPAGYPSNQPSAQPSGEPTIQPTFIPSKQPQSMPSSQPLSWPTRQPSIVPSRQPSINPSCRPSSHPSSQPKASPSTQPTSCPSSKPSTIPTEQPSQQPQTIPSIAPSSQSTSTPSGQPSNIPIILPSSQPSQQPQTLPSIVPSSQPTSTPSERPSSIPSMLPSSQPSQQLVTQPTKQPSSQPTTGPTCIPSIFSSIHPTLQPSAQPFVLPSSCLSSQPTCLPSAIPSCQPTVLPSLIPSLQLTSQPSYSPSGKPTDLPSCQPIGTPSSRPTEIPSTQPSTQPTGLPSSMSSMQPFTLPTCKPTNQFKAVPSKQPGSLPSSQPSVQPSVFSSLQSSDVPSFQPSSPISFNSTSLPTTLSPLSYPTTSYPSQQPTEQPSHDRSSLPSSTPTHQPTRQPSSEPSLHWVDETINTTLASLPSFRRISVLFPTSSESTTQFKIVLPFRYTSVVLGDMYGDIGIPTGIDGKNYIASGKLVNGSKSIDVQDLMFLAPAVSYDFTGRSVSNAGDVNGDGFDDLIIGMPYSSKVYVLYGNSRGFVDMSEGFTIFGAEPSELTGWSVSGAGDVNNDTIADIVIGAPNANNTAGAVYVIYGAVDRKFNVYLSKLNVNHGIALKGDNFLDYFGISVSGTGDVNGDGFDDVIIGSLRANVYSAGTAHVIFGSTTLKDMTMNADLPTSCGFVLFGAPHSWFGYSVSSAGDVNGDGYADILVGSVPQRSFADTQISYLIFGGETLVSVNVNSLKSTQVVVIYGGGAVVAGLGDVDNDGFGDVMVGNEYDFNSGGGFVVTWPENMVITPPSLTPTTRPSYSRTRRPTKVPTILPTCSPTMSPSIAPSQPTHVPSVSPSNPSSLPTSHPSGPSVAPSEVPTIVPSIIPSVAPSASDTSAEDDGNVYYYSFTEEPSHTPSLSSTSKPTTTRLPTVIAPTVMPSTSPSFRPTHFPVARPSAMPTVYVHTNITFFVKYIAISGNYARNSSNHHYIVNATHTVYIYNRGGRAIYTVLANAKSTLRIELFNHSADIIDLTAFTSIQNISDVNMTNNYDSISRQLTEITSQRLDNSVTIHLPNLQKIVLGNTTTGDITAENFIFHLPLKIVVFKHSEMTISSTIIISCLSVIVFLYISYECKNMVYDALFKKKYAIDWGDAEANNPTFIQFDPNESDRSLTSSYYSDSNGSAVESTYFSSNFHSCSDTDKRSVVNSRSNTSSDDSRRETVMSEELVDIDQLMDNTETNDAVQVIDQSLSSEGLTNKQVYYDCNREHMTDVHVQHKDRASPLHKPSNHNAQLNEDRLRFDTTDSIDERHEFDPKYSNSGEHRTYPIREPTFITKTRTVSFEISVNVGTMSGSHLLHRLRSDSSNSRLSNVDNGDEQIDSTNRVRSYTYTSDAPSLIFDDDFSDVDEDEDVSEGGCQVEITLHDEEVSTQQQQQPIVRLYTYSFDVPSVVFSDSDEDDVGSISDASALEEATSNNHTYTVASNQGLVVSHSESRDDSLSNNSTTNRHDIINQNHDNNTSHPSDEDSDHSSNSNSSTDGSAFSSIL